MNKQYDLSEFAAEMAEKAGVEKYLAQSFVINFIKTVGDTLATGEPVRITGLGLFRSTSIRGKGNVQFIIEKDVAERINAAYSKYEPITLTDDITPEMLGVAEDNDEPTSDPEGINDNPQEDDVAPVEPEIKEEKPSSQKTAKKFDLEKDTRTDEVPPVDFDMLAEANNSEVKISGPVSVNVPSSTPTPVAPWANADPFPTTPIKPEKQSEDITEPLFMHDEEKEEANEPLKPWQVQDAKPISQQMPAQPQAAPQPKPWEQPQQPQAAPQPKPWEQPQQTQAAPQPKPWEQPQQPQAAPQPKPWEQPQQPQAAPQPKPWEQPQQLQSPPQPKPWGQAQQPQAAPQPKPWEQPQQPQAAPQPKPWEQPQQPQAAPQPKPWEQPQQPQAAPQPKPWEQPEHNPDKTERPWESQMSDGNGGDGTTPSTLTIKKKSQPMLAKIVAVIVVAVIVLGLGYLFYDNLHSNHLSANQNVTEQKKEKNDEELNVKVEETKPDSDVIYMSSQADATPILDNEYKEDVITTGRMLTNIARDHYGRKDYWVYVYLENQDKIPNPRSITSGTKLRIAPRRKYDISTNESENLNNARELAKKILQQTSEK